MVRNNDLSVILINIVVVVRRMLRPRVVVLGTWVVPLVNHTSRIVVPAATLTLTSIWLGRRILAPSTSVMARLRFVGPVATLRITSIVRPCLGIFFNGVKSSTAFVLRRITTAVIIGIAARC